MHFGDSRPVLVGRSSTRRAVGCTLNRVLQCRDSASSACPYRAHPAAHVLFRSCNEGGASEGHPETRWTSGAGHDAAIYAPERRGDQVIGDRNGGDARCRGEIVEAAGTEGPKARIH